MATGRPPIFDHDMRLKVSKALHRKLTATAAKLRRTLPDFMRLVLEDAVAQPQDQSLRGKKLPQGFVFSKASLPGWTKE